jgi:hypothetical protein
VRSDCLVDEGDARPVLSSANIQHEGFDMLSSWERRLYAFALICVPLLDLTDDLINRQVLAEDYSDGIAGRVAMLTDLRLHHGLWQLDCFAALALGLLFVPAVIGALKLTRARAPRMTAWTALFVVPGAIGYAMHAIFWNLIFGGMSSSGTDLAAMANFAAATEKFPPFWVPLALVIIFANVGLILLGVALWRSRSVPLWAALCVVLYPINDLFGFDNLIYDVVDLLWLVGFVVTAAALLRTEAPHVMPALTAGSELPSGA